MLAPPPTPSDNSWAGTRTLVLGTSRVVVVPMGWGGVGDLTESGLGAFRSENWYLTETNSIL